MVAETDVDIQALRFNEFPITASWSYLNNADRGPLPRSHVLAATRALYEQMEQPYVERYDRTVSKLSEARSKLASLLNCRSADIAILGSTAQGLNLVAQGLDWHPRDEVVTYSREFPNLVFPWSHLRDRGVEIHFVPDRGNRFDVEDVKDAIGPRTRVVAVSLVNFAHGFRAPVEEIGALCKERGIWLVVDVIQALGAIEVDAPTLGADVLSAHAYKYLLGGFGVSVCYCSERARSELRVAAPGWFGRSNVEDVNGIFDYFEPFTDEARRFESSTPSLSGLYGLCASLDLLLAHTASQRASRVLQLNQYLADGLETRGWRVVSSQLPRERSSIVTAAVDGVDAEDLRGALQDHHIAASVRAGRGFRLSPHFYNTIADCDAVFSCLDDLESNHLVRRLSGP